MNNEEVLNFVQRNPVFYLATADNNMPHVRVMTVCKADENGILFNTKDFKKSNFELQNNPHVEMCFYSPKEGVQVRLSGKAELVDDLAIKKDIVRKFPILEHLVQEKGYSVIVPYCLKNWKTQVWTRSELGPSNTSSQLLREDC